jgi:hypothetical protein
MVNVVFFSVWMSLNLVSIMTSSIFVSWQKISFCNLISNNLSIQTFSYRAISQEFDFFKLIQSLLGSSNQSGMF